MWCNADSGQDYSMFLSRGWYCLEGRREPKTSYFITKLVLLVAQNIIVLWSSPNRKIPYISHFTCSWYHFHSPLNPLLWVHYRYKHVAIPWGSTWADNRSLKSLKWFVSRQSKQERLSKCSWCCSQKCMSRKCVETSCRVSVGLPVPIIPREVTVICGSTILGQWDEVWV